MEVETWLIYCLWEKKLGKYCMIILIIIEHFPMLCGTSSGPTHGLVGGQYQDTSKARRHLVYTTPWCPPELSSA